MKNFFRKGVTMGTELMVTPFLLHYSTLFKLSIMSIFFKAKYVAKFTIKVNTIVIRVAYTKLIGLTILLNRKILISQVPIK